MKIQQIQNEYHKLQKQTKFGPTRGLLGPKIGSIRPNRYFEGVGGFLEIPKVQEVDFP